VVIVDASTLVDKHVADLAVAAAREVISSIAQGSRMAIFALSEAMFSHEMNGPKNEQQ